jgi:hypothetical protein
MSHALSSLDVLKPYRPADLEASDFDEVLRVGLFVENISRYSTSGICEPPTCLCRDNDNWYNNPHVLPVLMIVHSIAFFFTATNWVI